MSRVLALESAGKAADMSESPAEQRLVRLGGRAYQVAARILGGAQAAEDVVQQAYLQALGRLRGGFSPDNEQAWFLKVVTNVARNQLREEAGRRRRERAVSDQETRAASHADPGEDPVADPFGSAPGRELVERLRSAMAALDEKYRLPLALCYEQGLTHREAAEILDVHQTTLSRHVGEGLEELRRALARSGHAAAPAIIAGGLAHTAPPVPAGLLAAIEKLAAGQLGMAGLGPSSGAAAVSAAAKGGMAMKIVVGVVAAGVLAGAGTLGLSVSGSRPATAGKLSAPPPAAGSPAPLPSPAGRGSEGEGKPAPVNPYGGMQQREEVFEFAQKPQVKKEGEKWVIAFASKGACDATVAMVDKDGKIVRHLASGVLGKNAPHPFQQNSLSQKLAWDGTDDRGHPVSAETLKGCQARVSLGLGCEFEKNLAWDPYEIPVPVAKRKDDTLSGYLVGHGPQGDLYVFGFDGSAQYHGRVYTKEGKYVRTFWPPSAKDVEKLPALGFKVVKTGWGDLVAETRRDSVAWLGDQVKPKTLAEAGKIPFSVAGISEYKEEPCPPCLGAPTLPAIFTNLFNRGRIRMAADRVREEIYLTQVGQGGFLMRFDGRTGKRDPGWFPENNLGSVTEVCVGPDGNVYLGVGQMGYNNFIVRLDHEGKVVQFGGDAIPIAKKKWEGGGGQYGACEGMGAGWDVCPAAFKKVEVKALWTGLFSHSNTHERGLYVSPRGHIVAAIQGPWAERAVKYGAPKEKVSLYKGRPYEDSVGASYVAVWDQDGKFLTANAVGDMNNGHGVTMDGDGNIYAVMAAVLPADAKTLAGLVDALPGGHPSYGGWGSLLKFRGGIPFPRAKTHPSARYRGNAPEPPPDATKLGGCMTIEAIESVNKSIQWLYPGVICQVAGSCTCHHLRYDMDYFARHWIPANYLGSVMVIDANANIVARIGRYGNVDDADPACGKVHLAWPKALCVSDAALYVADPTNRRILKAALKYAAEETVPVP